MKLSFDVFSCHAELRKCLNDRGQFELKNHLVKSSGAPEPRRRIKSSSRLQTRFQTSELKGKITSRRKKKRVSEN